MRRSRGTSGVGLSVALALIGSVLAAMGTSEAAAAPRAPGRTTSTRVLHRVVWDEFLSGRHGIHLWAAHVDGSHSRRIYTSHRGFTISVSLDRRGRRVAFAPCCSDDLPQLVVVPIAGGPVRRPLARHAEFYAVGGIGWSPHGSRLVFEGFTDPRDPVEALWTVRPDGSGLHRLYRLPPVTDGTWVDEALAWTRHGVLYSDGDDLRIAQRGRSHVLIAGAYSARISGDGQHLVTEHFNRTTFRPSVWYGNTDGTGQHRLWLGPGTTTSQAPRFGYPIPDFHGRRLLTTRTDQATDDQSGLVSWRVGTDPVHAPLLPFLAQSFAYTWN